MTDTQVRAAIAAGADDLYKVALTSAAGARCGGCLPTICELLEEAGHPCVRPSLKILKTVLADTLTAEERVRHEGLPVRPRRRGGIDAW